MTRKVALIIEAWDKYADKYRTYPLEYEFLKDELEELGLRRRIPNRILSDYPDVGIFRISDREWLIARLNAAPPERVEELLMVVDDFPLNHAFNTIQAYIFDARWKIAHHGERYYCCGMKAGRTGKAPHGGRRSYYGD